MSVRRRRGRRWVLLPALLLVVLGLVVVVMFGFALALGGTGDLDCASGSGSGAGGPSGPDPSRSAISDIPAARLAIYRQAGRAEDVDWTFLASIGAQECDHGSCAGDNGSGCAGPMQIAIRPGSPCSPGAGPTLWDRYKTDGDHDGHVSVNDPADAVFTAARVLREEKHAPATGGSYAQYRQAACDYYGACADGAASYADEVMRRAVQYGFHGHGSPAATDLPNAQPTPTPDLAGSTPTCGTPILTPPSSGNLGRVRKLTGPRRLERLPGSVVAAGFGAVECDARIVPDVEVLARRFGVRVTACMSIHSLAGEHPLGAAVDVVPADGDWDRTARLARAIGWNASCAASGVAPACARAPFRFVGYNGYPAHGDPAHCVPCGGGPHLHISWLTSASQGQPQNQSRTGHFAPDWIDTFDPHDAPSATPGRGRSSAGSRAGSPARSSAGPPAGTQRPLAGAAAIALPIGDRGAPVVGDISRKNRRIG